jgi:hypothetical protein
MQYCVKLFRMFLMNKFLTSEKVAFTILVVYFFTVHGIIQ